ncbi:hypothetical protein MAUB1S_02623 [Mycolicibacterium aubagnense]
MKPGVGTGTRIDEISLCPPGSSPVTAVTVTSLVMSVPEFVMNCLEPLMIQVSPSSFAVVLVAPASLPPPASVKPKAPNAFPLASSGSHSCFCSSLPNRYTGMAPSETPASSVIATLWSTLPSSSRARHKAK